MIRSPGLRSLLLSVCALSSAVILVRCGGGGNSSSSSSSPPSQPASTYTPTAIPTGTFDVSCDPYSKNPAQQQVPYQQQQTGSCTPQFQFYQSIVTNFHVNLDCGDSEVTVEGAGINQASATFPIQSDGSWSGQVSLDQQALNDGHGNIYCQVLTVVHFNGTATCGAQQGVNFTTSVDFAPGASSNALLGEIADLPSSSPLPDVSASVAPLPTDTEPSAAAVPGAPPSSSPSPQPSCGPGPVQPVSTSTLTINIPQGADNVGRNVFGPGPYQIQSGTTITWTNQDSVPHMLSATDGAFNSGLILPDKSYNRTFTVAGGSERTINYFLDFDNQATGQIQIVSPSPSVSPSVIPTVSPSPSVIPTVVPSSSPNPSVTTITQCVVVNPCPIVSRTNLQCSPAQQQYSIRK